MQVYYPDDEPGRGQWWSGQVVCDQQSFLEPEEARQLLENPWDSESLWERFTIHWDEPVVSPAPCSQHVPQNKPGLWLTLLAHIGNQHICMHVNLAAFSVRRAISLGLIARLLMVAFTLQALLARVSAVVMAVVSLGSRW